MRSRPSSVAETVDVAIAGGGIAGLTLAVLLAERGACASLAVFDSGSPVDPPGPEPGLRVSALSPGSRDVLEAAGAWSRIEACRAAPYSAMRVWDSASDWTAGDAIRFDAASLGLEHLGHIVENELVRYALEQRLRALGVQVRWGVGCASLERRRQYLELTGTDGQTCAAGLVVGADGVNSRVRELALIDVTEWDYRQRGFVAHAVTARPHRNTAWQRFTTEGPIALLPLADGRVSIVFSTDPDRARNLEKMPAAEASAFLTRRSGNVLGSLAIDSPRASFPLSAIHARCYTRERLVIVGDAAHRVHPLAGQGANLGIADVACLATEIASARRRGEDPGDRSVLRRYERRRRTENELMLRALDTLHRLFAHEGSGLAGIRRLGQRAFNRAPAVSRAVARQAMGLG